MSTKAEAGLGVDQEKSTARTGARASGPLLASVRLTQGKVLGLRCLLTDINQVFISLPQEGYVLSDWQRGLSAQISAEVQHLDALYEILSGRE